jgi:hypothetical protein
VSTHSEHRARCAHARRARRVPCAYAVLGTRARPQRAPCRPRTAITVSIVRLATRARQLSTQSPLPLAAYAVASTAASCTSVVGRVLNIIYEDGRSVTILKMV